MTSLSRLAGRAVQVIVIHVYRSRSVKFRFKIAIFVFRVNVWFWCSKEPSHGGVLSQQQHTFNMIEKKEKNQVCALVWRLSVMGRHFRFESFCEGFMFAKLRHMRSFEKIKSLRNGEITRLFTGTGKSCSIRDF